MKGVFYIGKIPYSIKQNYIQSNKSSPWGTSKLLCFDIQIRRIDQKKKTLLQSNFFMINSHSSKDLKTINSKQ